MRIIRSETMTVRLKDDIVLARQMVRARAAELGFGLVDQTRLVTAASELARNTVDHGRGGTMTIEEVSDGEREGLRLIFEDRGPGMADIGQALQDGFSTVGGLGLGLGGARRLMDELQIESEPDKGTHVTAVRWRVGGGPRNWSLRP